MNIYIRTMKAKFISLIIAITFCITIIWHGMSAVQTYLTHESNKRAIYENTSQLGRIEPTRQTGTQPQDKYVGIIPPITRISYSETWNGYKLPVITKSPIGALGNNMNQYATIFALNRIYNVSVVLHPTMVKELSIFKKLSLPSISDSQWSETKWIHLHPIGDQYNFVEIEIAASGLLGPYLFNIGDYPCEFHLFNQLKEELKKEFTFKDDINQRVLVMKENAKLLWIKNNQQTNLDGLNYIGIHIRRTSYIYHMRVLHNGKLPEFSYVEKAMQYYIRKHKKVIFIACSDDSKYISKMFRNYTNVLLSIGNTREVDMAVRVSCDHNIVTLGSFAFWGAYLAGGEVVYPDMIMPKSEYRFAKKKFEAAHLANYTSIFTT